MKLNQKITIKTIIIEKIITTYTKISAHLMKSPLPQIQTMLITVKVKATPIKELA